MIGLYLKVSPIGRTGFGTKFTYLLLWPMRLYVIQNLDVANSSDIMSIYTRTRNVDKFLFMNVDAYKCPKCGKELLDIETASKVMREFALRHVEEIKGYEVKISSDGRNYLIRFPKELSDILATKKIAKILPINTDEFIIKVA